MRWSRKAHERPQESRAVFDTDPTAWRWSTWWLYAVAAWYMVNFFVFWFRFKAGERKAKAGAAADVTRYNRMLRGFPNAVFAKMFGKRPYEVPKPEEKAQRTG